MKRIPIFIYAIAVAALVASSCRNERKYENTMFVSIAPIKQIVTEIVGDDFDVEILVPAGASPETFEPTPKQFIELNDARLIFSTGLLVLYMRRLESFPAVRPLFNLIMKYGYN